MMVQQTCFHLMTSISAMAFRFSMHIMQGNLAPNQRWAVFLFLKNDKYGTRKKNKRNISIDINNPHTSYSRVFEVFEELLQKR